jgi:large subunit ribosomal protein L6
MSKIGNSPVKIPSNVKVEIKGSEVVVTGPKGVLNINTPHYLTVLVDSDAVSISRNSDGKRQKSNHGLYRSIISNAVLGVDKGWSKKLEIVGTGYNVKMQGADLNFRLGYSHTVVYKSQKGIQLSVEGNNVVIVSGFDKHLVGEVAQQIKSLKKPDPYKGKGIRYLGEYIKLKPGKKAKA